MTPSEVRLVEKITRAKVKLERARRAHSSNCIVEMDPEGLAPCNCGAGSANFAIDAALRELELE